jgi:hypothetical protein
MRPLRALRLVARIKQLERLRDEIQERRALRPTTQSTSLPSIGDLPLLELVPRLSPGNDAPAHLPWLIDELELAIAPHEGQRYRWFSVPPRHWKTTTLVHAIVKHLIRHPTEMVLFITHTDDYAKKVSREVQKLALRAGLRISRSINRQDEWELETGGGLVAKPIGAGIAGRGFRLIVCDDPIKGRDEARSKARRDAIFEVIDDDVLTRLSPDGTLFLVHTRWHPDDPIGRFKKRHDWQGKNIPALAANDNGDEDALLPDHWGVPYLRGIRKANPQKFASLYQGEPILAGEALFREPARYEWPSGRPRSGYRVAYGVDLAYSSRNIGDWSVCIRLIAVNTGDTEKDPDSDDEREIWHYYVTDVVRKHVDAPSFALAIKACYSQEPGPMRWDRNTVEEGSAQFIKDALKRQGIRPEQFKDVLAKGQPVDRVQWIAEQWNLGRVLVPGRAENDDTPLPDWVEDFVDELTTMTGINDAHDDQAVALASAFELLKPPKVVRAYAKARAFRAGLPRARE